MAKTTDNRQILTQVISLPLLLGALLLVTGLGGIYISRESTAELQRLNDKAVGPTMTFAEIVAQLNETSQIILRASSEGTSDEERESLLKKTRNKMKKISKMTKEALQASQGYAYSEYFTKWAADWETFQNKVTVDTAFYKDFASHINETDKELGELIERIGNVSTFIQADVKDIVDQSAAFLKKATYGLASLLAIGLIIGLAFSTIIVRGIRRLLTIIDTSKKNMKTLLDNLDQGFLVFDRSGKIQPEVSRAASDFFGSELANANFVNALPLDEDEKRSAASWLELVYGGALTFKSLADLAPESFESKGRYIELHYRPIYKDGSDQALDKVICVASDKTEERNLRRRAEAESTLVRVVMKVLSDRPAFVDFVLETRSLFKDLFAELAQREPRIDNLFRATHSIKGSFGTYSFDELARSAHHFENQLADLRGQPLGNVLALVPELKEGLVQLQRDFEDFLVKHESVIGPTKESADRTKNLPVSQIHRICQLLEAEIGKESQIFQTYVKNFVQDDATLLFQRYESVVTGVAERQMKSVEFKMNAGGVKVFSDPYLPLANAYVHVFRNAVDHGIEDPEERIESGKPETAHVEVRMSELPNANGQNILRVEVVDDGRGVNPKIIRQKAVEKGVISQSEVDKMTDHEVVQLLFRAGFSTNNEVTDLSGRGVGLDAVKYEVEKLGGTIRIESEVGKGTRVIADLPHFKSVISAQQQVKPNEMRMAS